MADVIIIYDSKTGNTEKVATEIFEGVKESGASVEMKKVEDATVDDVKGAKGVILGSPCLNDNYSHRLRSFMEDKLVEAKPSDKVGAAFGTYKWNGGNLHKLEQDMRWMGIGLVAEGINVHRFSGQEVMAKLRELGKAVGEKAKK
jgi:flavorubredoxin